ncbi:MAG: hypothetical protein ACFFD2_01155 [Promethearchaeota archaeon]
MEDESYYNSLKSDIVPIINVKLQMDENQLYALNTDALNEIFSVLQTKVISVEKIRKIIINNLSSSAVIDAIKKDLQSSPPLNTPTSPVGMSPSPRNVSPSSTNVFHSPVDVPQSPVDVPQSPVDVPQLPVDVPQSPVDVPQSPAKVSPYSVDTTISSMHVAPMPNTMFVQDSIKADIIPAIQNVVNVSSEKLFTLSVEVLNQIFGYIQTGILPVSKIESIIRSSKDSNEISSKLQVKTSEAISSGNNLMNDLITGILFNIPENFRDQVEPRLREIENTDVLAELSQLDLPEIQSRLGIEIATPQIYNEKLDIIAGILAQLPPSLQGIIGDRLNEIEDIDRLNRLSQMNYVQIQQALGLVAQSPSALPANVINPIDTASHPSSSSTPPSSSPSSPQSQVSTSGQSSSPSHRVQEMMRKRREENQQFIPIIQKMVEKVWKIKISEGDVLSPESEELKEKIKIIQRIHPDRVAKIIARLKGTKDKNRFKALFEWYIYSQRIEEIETYVEHWQGQIQGIGGFRAAINVSRFDPIVEHSSTKDIEKLVVQAKKSLEQIHSDNLSIRAQGVEAIKQISNYLLQKATH